MMWFVIAVGGFGILVAALAIREGRRSDDNAMTEFADQPDRTCDVKPRELPAGVDDLPPIGFDRLME